MPLTALDLSPEALKKYHPREAIRRRRAKTRTQVTSRRRRAYAVALKAAKLLKTKFGATEVILFGSLARRGSFTLYSDIDLAERGIHSDDYLTAMETVLYMNPEFKIDLVNPEFCSTAMRAEIEKDGKPL
ncbi:MAG: nucleotidyltransferase domain-containing protein [Chloroflexi bacterium]|nr:nucleotidyltransferase domain-containing protein [Chloroflexota bacterium]